MKLGLIVCTDNAGGIAKNGSIPWKNKDDLRFFRVATTGNNKNAVIMGRTTFESLPYGALPNRLNIIVSRKLPTEQELREREQDVCANDDCKVVRTPLEAIDFAEELGVEEAWIIGGKQIYQALELDPRLSVVFHTVLNEHYHCDLEYSPQLDDFDEVLPPMAIEGGYVHAWRRCCV